MKTLYGISIRLAILLFAVLMVTQALPVVKLLLALTVVMLLMEVVLSVARSQLKWIDRLLTWHDG